MEILTAVLAFASSYLLGRRMLDPRSPLYTLDHPNERSLHSAPTPRGGGVAIAIALYVCGALAVAWYGEASYAAPLAVAGLLVIAVSYFDDRSHVPALYRIAVHTAAAAILLLGGLTPDAIRLPGVSWQPPPSWLAALTILYVVWMVNLYNFMDGMDGFAGGMALFGFATFALLGAASGHGLFMSVSMVAAAAAGGFLFLNFPPARLFMGDIGSSLLGLAAAGLSLWADRDRIFALWIAVLVFSPFIVDATVTLALRLSRRERVWEAHRSHFYQRLVRLGWGHRRTVLGEYLLMAACCASALVAAVLPTSGQRWLLCVWILVYSSLMWTVHRLELQRIRTTSL